MPEQSQSKKKRVTKTSKHFPPEIYVGQHYFRPHGTGGEFHTDLRSFDNNESIGVYQLLCVKTKRIKHELD